MLNAVAVVDAFPVEPLSCWRSRQRRQSIRHSDPYVGPSHHRLLEKRWRADHVGAAGERHDPRVRRSNFARRSLRPLPNDVGERGSALPCRGFPVDDCIAGGNRTNITIHPPRTASRRRLLDVPRDARRNSGCRSGRFANTGRMDGAPVARRPRIPVAQHPDSR